MKSFRLWGGEPSRPRRNANAGYTRQQAEDNARWRRENRRHETKAVALDQITATLVEYLQTGLPDGIKVRYDFELAALTHTDARDGVMVIGSPKAQYLPYQMHGHGTGRIQHGTGRIQINVLPTELRITGSRWNSKAITILTADPNFFTVVPRTIMQLYNEFCSRKEDSLYG